MKDYLPDCNNNYQDLHAVSVYLSHRYPDIYYIYRPWEFESFNRLIGNEYSFKRGKDQNYISYLQLCNDLNAILRREIEIDEGFKYEIDTAVNSNSKYYKDPEYHILTQDFIYSIVNYYDDDMTGRYDKVLKNKPIVPEVEEITVEELSAANTTKNTNKKTEQPIKIDYVARQRVNSRLGNTGERWAEEFERKRLTQGGRKDLAKKVERVSKKDDSLGYDIASFNLDGTPLWIEVKTTNEGKNTPFFISDLELKTCQENLDKYRLYRVYNLTKGAKVRIISGDLNKLNPVPTTYRIKTED